MKEIIEKIYDETFGRVDAATQSDYYVTNGLKEETCNMFGDFLDKTDEEILVQFKSCLQ